MEESATLSNFAFKASMLRLRGSEEECLLEHRYKPKTGPFSCMKVLPKRPIKCCFMSVHLKVGLISRCSIIGVVRISSLSSSKPDFDEQWGSDGYRLRIQLNQAPTHFGDHFNLPF